MFSYLLKKIIAQVVRNIWHKSAYYQRSTRYLTSNIFQDPYLCNFMQPKTSDTIFKQRLKSNLSIVEGFINSTLWVTYDF